MDSSKALINIFVIINGEKVKDNNKDAFHKIILKGIEVKNEFQELNFKIGNIDVNLSIKIKNIFGGKGFGSRMDMFKTKTNTNESAKVMTTGVSMKDRLNLFNNRGIPQPQQAPQNKPPPKKIRPSMDFANKLMNNVGAPNKASNTINQNENKKEEPSKEIKEKDNKNNDKPIEKKNDVIKEEVKNEEDKRNKIDENQNDKKENVEESNNQEQNNEEQKKEIQKIENKEEEINDNNQKEKDKNNIDNDKEKTTEEAAEGQLETPKEENDNQKNEDKNADQNEDNNLKKKEAEEVIIENKNENKTLFSKANTFQPKDNLFNKRQSMQIPSISQINLSNKVNLDSKEQPKKQVSKKIDNYKMLLGQRLLGLPLRIPQKENTQKKEEDKKNITSNPEENKSENNPTPTEPQSENPQNSITPTPIPNETPTPIENSEEENPIDLIKKGSTNCNEEAKISKENELQSSMTIMRKSAQINSITIDDFDFEVLESDSSQDSLIEGFLDPVNYDKYLSDLKQQGKKEDPREAFCEGFFIASYPRKDGKVIEKSDGIPSLCGHDECKVFYAMKPEIVMRYPLKDTKSLELNNLAATICFPNGIKVCYSDNEPPKKMEDYVTQITNQKGERYYMKTFHFYHKMSNIEYGKIYDTSPLKSYLVNCADTFSVLPENEIDERTNEIQQKLDFCHEVGFRDILYIPYCICLISKYSYITELDKSINTIYKIMKQEPNKLNFVLNDLIMYLVHSVPIPDKNMRVRFYIPYNNEKMELLCHKMDDLSTTNGKLIKLFDYFHVDKIIIIFRLLLSEKKILFIHDDYTTLSEISDFFISLLYPFKWIHTYIPIMSDQMLKYLETFLPFVNGIHESLMDSVEKIFIEGEFEESEEIFLVNIKKQEITLSKTKNKSKIGKYIQNNVLPLPFEKDLKNKLTKIYGKIKDKKKLYNSDRILYEKNIRDSFIEVFVEMFYDYEKYVGILDDDVIFNKVLFMNSISKDKKFYDEFIDCQLFQQFTQNITKDGFSYFNKKIKEKKENDSKKKDNKNEKDMNINQSSNKKEKENLYIIKPDYLGVKENDRQIIELTIKNDYNDIFDKNDEDRILNELYLIEPEKYNNSKCIIYLTPEKNEPNAEDNKIKLQEMTGTSTGMKQRSTTIFLAGRELSEKQKDQIKEEIKDMVVKIFKSEIDSSENKALKNEAFTNLNTDYGRAFFVSLISNKNNNIISLQENSFNFLEAIIHGIFNLSLKLEETDQLILEIIILIKSTKFFETEKHKKDKKDKKGKKHDATHHITLFEKMKSKFQSYNKINQKNLWKKWFELDLQKKTEEVEEIDDKIKADTIVNVCKQMIDLEISKSIVKNVIDSINDSVFGSESENYINTQEIYRNLITHSQYISSTSKK